MAMWTKATLCGKSSLLEQNLPGTPSRLTTSVTSVISVANNLFNQRNPRLINDLRVCKLLYICRESSTYIESSLQNNLFMQNKANFQKVKQLKPIKANSKPKQTQFQPVSNQLHSAICRLTNAVCLIKLDREGRLILIQIYQESFHEKAYAKYQSVTAYSLIYYNQHFNIV
jgi:hypothetical protein